MRESIWCYCRSDNSSWVGERYHNSTHMLFYRRRSVRIWNVEMLPVFIKHDERTIILSGLFTRQMKPEQMVGACETRCWS